MLRGDLFEEVYRSRRVAASTSLGANDPGVTMQRLVAAVPDYAVEDLVTLVAIAADGVGDLRAATVPEAVVVAPTLRGHRRRRGSRRGPGCRRPVAGRQGHRQRGEAADVRDRLADGRIRTARLRRRAPD